MNTTTAKLTERRDFTLGRYKIPNGHNTGYTWRWWYSLHHGERPMLFGSGFATKAEARAAALAGAEQQLGESR